MVWFFIGGIAIAVFLLGFLLVDLVYAYKVYTGSNISNAEGIMLIVINVLAVVIVLSMLAMFFFQVFMFIRKKGSFGLPPITPEGIAKEFNLDIDDTKHIFGGGKDAIKEKIKMLKGELKGMGKGKDGGGGGNGGCGSVCGYKPPQMYY